MKPLITEVAKLPRHQWRQSTLRHEVSHHRPQKGAGREPRFSTHKSLPEQLPLPKEVNVHPSNPGGENASFFFFVGTATTMLYAHLMAQSQGKVQLLMNS